MLSYFGEKNPERCGQCDVCTRRNELDLSKYEFDIILDEIKEKLPYNLISLDELMKNLHTDEEKNLKVIRWLLDNEKIKKDQDNLLTWNLTK